MTQNNDAFVHRIKVFIKRSPLAFFIIYCMVGLSFHGKSPKKALREIPKGSVILNFGSGVSKIREDVTNIDFYLFENVDIVADIAHVPFPDNSADAVICEHVLEHVPDPKAVIAEMRRVLRPGGIVYIVTPFVMGFHSSPHDFRRWSKMGLEEECKDFQKVESGVRSGPGAAVDYILAEYMGTLFSFGSKKLQQILFMIFLVLFAPLCYLDYIIGRFPTSENIAHAVYYIGKKQ